MRKTVYGIGLLSVTLLLALGFYVSYRHNSSDMEPTSPQTVEAENAMQTRYHIGMHEGTIIVRLEDGSVFETTDITWDSLPASVQKDIADGYVLESKQELYSFLENYSS